MQRVRGGREGRLSAPFAAAAFTGATLLFTVEPMTARLVLPRLGGSSAVWNTCVAFFQIALLAGYLYAHLLTRRIPARWQAAVHAAVLFLSGLLLPLHISGLLGDPWTRSPSLWLLLTLTLSIGAPFAALSATAPLIQTWRARAGGGEGVWSLYAISNLGSLLGLLAYPFLIEPRLTLVQQRWGWSLGYGVFVLLILAAGWTALSIKAALTVSEASEDRSCSLGDRLRWLGLSALPASLMLGVTTYLTTDVASAPFLWVGPLALYLVSFVIAFSHRPLISPRLALILQALILPVCIATYPFHIARLWMWLVLLLHLVGYFLTALVCHQALAARRPSAARLTEFYLVAAAGGVLGGLLNAFLAPLIFSTVAEYPLALVLACLPRPWSLRTLGLSAWLIGSPSLALAGLASILLAVHLTQFSGPTIAAWVLALAALLGVLANRHAPVLLGVAAVLTVSASAVGDRVDILHSWRSFFGVLRTSHADIVGIGQVRMLSHGTTLHGAQALDPALQCRPLVYYAPETPIGQVFSKRLGPNAEPARIGVVGLGSGSSAAYERAGDSLTYFEIDPLVVKIATDPKNFTYISRCAKGSVHYVLGDARLGLAKQPQDQFDLILLDAFSSDAIPTHLLTVEAIRTFLARLRPDGVVILHLSNRNLDLTGPAQAAVAAAGGFGLLQQHLADPQAPLLWESDEVALLAARTQRALTPYLSDPRWRPIDARGARPWTDDYSNLFGAMVSRIREAAAAR